MYSLSIANLLFMLSDCGFCYRSSKNRAQLKATHGLSVRCWYLICRLNLTSKKMFCVAPSNTDTDTDRYYSGRKNANTHAIWTPNVRPKDVRYRILFIYRRAHTRTHTKSVYSWDPQNSYSIFRRPFHSYYYYYYIVML